MKTKSPQPRLFHQLAHQQILCSERGAACESLLSADSLLSTPEEILEFQRQEKERFAHPELPFTYK